MEIKEAIEALNNTKYFIKNPNESKARKLAIESLEKQIPKKPTIKSFKDIMRMMVVQKVICPNCGEYITMIEFETEKKRIFENHKSVKHCDCGQKLNWDVE
jgi:hypothetical protein